MSNLIEGKYRQLVSVVLLGCLATAVAIGGTWRREPRMPVPMLASDHNRLDSDNCRDCHSEIVDGFDSAPHQVTLRRPGESSLWERFVDRELETPLGSFRFTWDDGQLRMHGDRLPQPVTVDWVFGSGQHALTPVAIRQTVVGDLEANQLHVSWFANDTLGLTPGSESVATDPPSAGIVHDHQQAAECFACHSSYLPQVGDQIDLTDFRPGVSCVRCHPGGRDHADSDGAIATLTPWHELTPLESIRRCGECHRRADQMTADEITVDRANELARFAPVGLVQSRCFTESLSDVDGTPLRMDCVTCHDPHRPARRDPTHYNDRCNDCHGDAATPASACSVSSSPSNCVACHMPQVSAADQDHLRFTDHWIRIPRQ